METSVMTSYTGRLRRNIRKNLILDRELDFLPATVDRDEVRDLARRYGPQRRRSLPARIFLGMSGFILRYSAPFIGMIVGAEYRAAKALYPLIGKEEHYGESLRVFLGDTLTQKIDDTSKAFKVTGALVAATPDIIFAALYGALIGIIAYYAAKWLMILGGSYRRRMKLNRKISELVS